MSYCLKSPLKSAVLRLKSFLVPALLVLLLVGCQSYQIVQRNIFADDDGRVIVVDYGRSDSDHHNSFISPVTGKEMDFHTRLMVKVQLPNGDTIKAWQCMNFLPRGTMYETDNKEWKLLANGFSCIIYHRTGEPPPRDYLEVYRGVICDTPDREVKRNDKWRDITNLGKGREYRKPPEKATK